MHFLLPIVIAVIIVFFGYFAIWSSNQPSTPQNVAGFGKVLAIVFFVIAGLALISPIVVRPDYPSFRHGMAGIHNIERSGLRGNDECPGWGNGPRFGDPDRFKKSIQGSADKTQPDNTPKVPVEKSQNPAPK